MLVRDTSALLAACWIAGAAIAQDEAPWLSTTRVDVSGNTTFSTDAIRDELHANTRVADALLRAANASERTAVLADCVADGYRQAGFANVAARGRREDGRVLVQVVEGTRSRVGVVRVTGNRDVAADELATTMRNAEGSWRGWHGDGWADCSSVALARARQRIVIAYARTGRWGAVADVALERVEQRVDLVVTVHDEGRFLRVGRLQLEGERPDDVEAVLQRIRPDEDAPLTVDLVRSLRMHLEDLGRYLAVGSPIDANRLETASTSPIVPVKVASFAPPMKDMPWDDLTQLRAGLATVRAHLDAGKAMRIVATFDAEIPLLGFSLLPGPVSFTFGKDGFGARCERVKLPDGSVGAVEVLMTSTRAFVALGDGSCGVASYGNVRTMVSVTLAPNDDGSFGVRWGVGLSAIDDKQPTITTWTHPATALRLLQRGYVTRAGDDLVVHAPGGAVLVDRAGGVRSKADDGAPASELLPMTFGALLDEAQRRFDEARVRPLGAYLLSFGTEHAAALRTATTPVQRDALACLRAGADWWNSRRTEAAIAETGEEEFSVPGSGQWPGLAGVIAPAVFLAAKHTPETSWLHALARPLRALMQRRSDGLQAISTVATADASGPFATAAAAALLDAAGYDNLTSRHWQRAIERCTAELAVADLRALVSAEAPPTWLADLATHLRTDERTAAIFTELPADASPLDVLAIAFARCWDAGLGAGVQQALQETRLR